MRGVRDYMVRDGGLAWLLGTEAVAVVFFAAVVPVEVVFVKATLHAGDSGYGALVCGVGGRNAGRERYLRARRVSVRLALC